MKRLGVSKFFPHLLLSPALAMILLFIAYPILLGFYTSLQHYVLIDPFNRSYIGLQNYTKLIPDPAFWVVMRNTVIWVTGSVVAQVVLGMILALLLNVRIMGRSVIRSVVFSPWAVSSVIIATMWKLIYSPQIGPLNDILLQLGVLERRIAFLATTDWAMAAVIVANVWKGIPFFAIMILAGLQSIPTSLYEAAYVDGASAWRSFRDITLPLMRHIILAAVVLRVIWVFNEADLIFVLTNGGPVYATETLATYVFKTAYRNLDFGIAATLGTVMFLILSAIAATYVWLNRKEEGLY